MDVFAELAVNVFASAILLGFGFLGGKYRERRLQRGRNLEEYDFYPFDVDAQKVLFLDLDRFSAGVGHFLRHRDATAAARKFKCTTIPIYRENLGLVGAICINVDYNYIDEVVRRDPEQQALFFDALLRTDMALDENILSKDEYDKAREGKRHFRDFGFRAASR